jgi:hypothetical protein
MSHVAKIKIEVRSLSALIEAANRCGLEFRENQKSYRWYGRSEGDYPLPEGITADQLGRCDHALCIPGNPRAYEIGIKDMGNGTYSLLWDFWQGGFGLVACVGQNGDTLVSEYALQAAQEAANQQGWYTERQADSLVIYHPDGGTITVDATGAVDASHFMGQNCLSACAPIESALGSKSEVSLKAEFYQRKQLLMNQGE